MTSLFSRSSSLKMSRCNWLLTIQNIHKCFVHFSHGRFPVLFHQNSGPYFLISNMACIASCHSSQSLAYFCISRCNTVGPMTSNRQPFVNVSNILANTHDYSNWKMVHGLRSQTASFCTDEIQTRGPEVEKIVKEILRATKETDVMADSLPKDAVEKLVKKLEHQNFDKKKIQKLLSRRLWLLQQPDETASLTQHLLIHNFPRSTVCQIIAAIPYSLQNSLDLLPEIINETIFFFGSQGILERDLISIFNSSPDVLFLDVKAMGKVMSSLKSIFSAKDARKLVKKSPSLFTEDWSEVICKYNYAIYTMVYTNDDIVNSHLFSHTLEHIRNRHLFLVRAGLFMALSHKLNPALNPNPTLSNVVDTSNSTFIKLFPVTDLKGYDIFWEMRALEQEGEYDELYEFVEEEFDVDEEYFENERDIVTNSGNKNDYKTKAFSKTKEKSRSKHKKQKRL